MSAPTYRSRWPTYARWWTAAKIRPEKEHEVLTVARHILPFKARYVALEKTTGVPWFEIAALHNREAGTDKNGNPRFDRQLAQGDPLNRRAVNEPHSGPFKTFEDSAVWALEHDHMIGVKDWTIEKLLYFAEAYNGWGYYSGHPDVPSPYVVGGTTVQKPGKYVRDHVFDHSVMDSQLGVMAIILGLMQVDPSIKVARETPDDTKPIPVNVPTPVNRPVPKPAVPLAKKPVPDVPEPVKPVPAGGSPVVNTLVSWLANLFRRA